MNFRHTGRLIDLGEALDDLALDQSVWSQATFGSDSERGPIGALRHLEKEAVEAAEACSTGSPAEKIQEELADCFLLILDASRRAGVGPLQLLKACHRKMQVNKSRSWPTPVPDVPVEHIQ